MMRLLHTADWHVGKTIRGRTRYDEYAAALDQVVAVAEAEGVDAVVVAGDLYDMRALSHDADALIFDTLIRLHEKRIPVVAIPGNHDSAARLEALAPLLAHIGVTVVAKVARPQEGGVLEIPSRDGTRTALIACTPFVSPRRFSGASALFEDPAAPYSSYDEEMGRLLDAMCRSFRADCVNVLLGHMFIAGTRPGGGEREITIGADYAVSPSRLPSTASYVALGHIHRPQSVPATGAQARYAGSLIQLDFGERDQQKSVVVVDVAPGKPARAKEVPIEAGRKLVDVRGKLDDLPRVAEHAGDAYLRVYVQLDEIVPRIADLVRDVMPNALDVVPEYEAAAPSPEPEVSLRSLASRDQFTAYYRAAHSADPSKELMAAFDRVHADVAGPG